MAVGRIRHGCLPYHDRTAGFEYWFFLADLPIAAEELANAVNAADVPVRATPVEERRLVRLTTDVLGIHQVVKAIQGTLQLGQHSIYNDGRPYGPELLPGVKMWRLGNGDNNRYAVNLAPTIRMGPVRRKLSSLAPGLSHRATQSRLQLEFPDYQHPHDVAREVKRLINEVSGWRQE